MIILEEIISFYVENLSNFSLVTKYMKLSWDFLRVIIIIAPLVSLSLLPSGWLFVSTPIAILYAYIYYFDWRFKYELKKRLNINSYKGFFEWDNIQLEKHKQEILKHYLQERNIEGKKTKNLISLLNKEIEDVKESPFIIPGIALAVFLPAWSAFSNRLFNPSEVNFDLAIKHFEIIVILIFILIPVIWFKEIIKELYFNKEILHMKSLIKLLEISSLNEKE